MFMYEPTFFNVQLENNSLNSFFQESVVPSLQPPPHTMAHPHSHSHPMAASSDAMQWSIWSTRPDNQYKVLPDCEGGVAGAGAGPVVGMDSTMVGSAYDTLQIHQVSYSVLT